MSSGALGQLSGEQRSVLTQIVAYGKRLEATPKAILSAVETGIVEDTLHNEDRGTGTSVGWRQEISSFGTVAERLDLADSIPTYYGEAKQEETAGQTAGELAAAVQRPEEQFRGRYSEEESLAEQLLHELGDVSDALAGTVSPSSSSSTSSSPSTSVAKKGETFDTLVKGVLYASLLAGGGVVLWLGTKDVAHGEKS